MDEEQNTNKVNEQEIQWQINNASRHFAPNGTITITNATNTTCGTTSINAMYSNKRLISVTVKEITVEIAYRETPMFTYTVYGPSSTPPDRVWKEVYGLKDGKMTLLEIIQGKHIREYHVPESFLFDDDTEVKSSKKA